ncbi:hypothetical protein ACWJJH_10735 [Endozoicomonadaceae bacterium StTr2]
MFIAFEAAHSTGKTTTSSALLQQLNSADNGPDKWILLPDYYRVISIELGYQRPRDIILEHPETNLTVTAMVASALGAQLQWLEHIREQGLHGIIDAGTATMLCYPQHWLEREGQQLPPYILKLAERCSQLIDYFIYLPINTIPLEDDGVRSMDPAFQQTIDQLLQSYLQVLASPAQVLWTENIKLEDRLAEIQTFITPGQSR